MVGRFKPVRGREGAVQVTLDETLAGLLTDLVTQLLELLDEGREEAPEDPLAAALGIGSNDTLPDDPVLARLFPDGYTDDPEASGEFRRYTENGLRERKRATASTVLATLQRAPGKVVLEPDEAMAWLTGLNDVRLAVAERLGLAEELARAEERGEAFDVAEDDPRLPVLVAYDALTWMQETLVQALS